MHKYKLINYKDIFKLFAKRWYLFLIGLALLFAIFFAAERGAGEKSYIAKASISLNYYEDGHFDYDQSQKLTSNFNRFTIDESALSIANGNAISLKPVQYSNILYATCISKDPQTAIDIANKLAELQCETILESNVDGINQKTIFKIEQKAYEASLNNKNITSKQKVSFTILMLGLIMVALVLCEIWRTNVCTAEEARLITNCNYIVDVFSKGSVNQDALTELKKVINGRSFNIVPISAIRNAEAIEQGLENNSAFTKDLLKNPSVIDVLRESELALIYIKKGTCDYRDLERATGIIKAAEINLFGVILG